MEQWNASKEPCDECLFVCACVLHSLFINVFVHIYLLMCLCSCVMLRWVGLENEPESTEKSSKLQQSTASKCWKLLPLLAEKKQQQQQHQSSKTGFVNANTHTYTHMLNKTERSNKTFVRGIQAHWKTTCTANWRTHTHTHIDIAASQIEKRLGCSTKVQQR